MIFADLDLGSGGGDLGSGAGGGVVLQPQISTARDRYSAFLKTEH